MTNIIKAKNVFERLKIILDTKLDADIERALNIGRGDLYHYRKRDSVPYPQLVDFCLERNIEINYVLGKKVSQ